MVEGGFERRALLEREMVAWEVLEREVVEWDMEWERRRERRVLPWQALARNALLMTVVCLIAAVWAGFQLNTRPQLAGCWTEQSGKKDGSKLELSKSKSRIGVTTRA